jgi:hypothetical protein
MFAGADWVLELFGGVGLRPRTLVKIFDGLKLMSITYPELLVKVTEVCVVERMQPSGVASVAVMLMDFAESVSSYGMTRAAMAGSFFKLNLLT